MNEHGSHRKKKTHTQGSDPLTWAGHFLGGMRLSVGWFIHPCAVGPFPYSVSSMLPVR